MIREALPLIMFAILMMLDYVWRVHGRPDWLLAIRAVAAAVLVTTIFGALLCGCSFTGAQEGVDVGACDSCDAHVPDDATIEVGGADAGSAGSGMHDALPSGTIVLREAADDADAGGHSDACVQAGGATAAAIYERVFPLTTLGVSGPFTVTGVTFSIEAPDGGGTIRAADQISVEVGTYTGAVGVDVTSLDNTKITWVASTSANVAAGSSPRAVSAPIVATQVAAASTIVIAIGLPSYVATSGSAEVGGTAGGEALPSYFTAATCGMATPTATDIRSGRSVGAFIIDVEGTSP
jgi:hypothetical protein